MWPCDEAVIAQAIPLIRAFEGFKSAPYLCPAGIPTIGYGSTAYPDGRSVTLKDPAITNEQGEALLFGSAAKKWNSIKGAIKNPPSVCQAAAMLSLAYNIGVSAFRASTVLRLFNDNDIAGAASAFLMWDKITKDGKTIVSDGLRRRRESERDLFLSPAP